MPAVQIIQRIPESGVAIAIESPVVRVFELTDIRLGTLPCGSRTEDEGRPRHSVQRLAVVIPCGIQHAHSSQLLTVAYKVANIHKRDIQIRPHLAPVVRSRRDTPAQASVPIRFEDAVETRLG